MYIAGRTNSRPYRAAICSRVSDHVEGRRQISYFFAQRAAADNSFCARLTPLSLSSTGICNRERHIEQIRERGSQSAVAGAIHTPAIRESQFSADLGHDYKGNPGESIPREKKKEFPTFPSFLRSVRGLAFQNPSSPRILKSTPTDRPLPVFFFGRGIFKQIQAFFVRAASLSSLFLFPLSF